MQYLGFFKSDHQKFMSTPYNYMGIMALDTKTLLIQFEEAEILHTWVFLSSIFFATPFI